jgi:regulator of protease activity HflC (stomatin/prohibitin superfamily)
MQKLKVALAAALTIFVIVGLIIFINLSKVPAGNVGIKVYLLGGSKGVESEELGVGRYWIGINEELYLFPTFTQNYVWTKDKNEGSENDESITFQTAEGLSVNADVGISYHIDPVKVNMIFQKYRRGITEITDIFLRNMVRDAFNVCGSTVEVESAYGVGKAKLIQQVQDMVVAQVQPIGIEIEKIYLIGNMRLPDQVIQALNAKISATQKAQQRENEVREATAEAEKKIAAADGEAKSILRVAEAQAQANMLLVKSITPELIQYESMKKWDGKLPQLMGGDGVLPMINIK